MVNKGLGHTKLCYNKLMVRKCTKPVFLMAFFVFALMTFISYSANATTITGGDIKVVAGIEAVLRVTLPNDILVKIDPGNKDPFVVPINLDIYSNNPQGYYSYISVNKNRSDLDDAATALVHVNNDNNYNYMINSLTENKTFADFPAGYWGYSLDGGKTFDGVPAADETPANVSTSSELHFGVKVPGEQASGIYSNTIVVTAVSRHVQTPADLFSGITYMQDMTQEICETENLGATKQLIDRRDNKVYWVTKMNDNNCWMTQNLDFEISENGTELTPATSNVFATRTITKDLSGSGDYNDIFYLDGGDYYVPNGVGDLERDMETHATKLESTAELDPTSEDWHYHIGSLYSWNAATAGSADETVLIGEADESICPKGWRLPIQPGSIQMNRNYGIYKLFRAQREVQESSHSEWGFGMSAIGQSPFYYTYTWGEFVTTVDGISRATDHTIDYTGWDYKILLLWSSTATPLTGAYGYVSPDSTIARAALTIDNAGADTILDYARHLEHGDESVTGKYRWAAGFVRCVSSKNDLYSISTMQEMTPEIIANTDIESTKQLTDVRDGKKYWVTKEYDGNIWMTQNLDFEISTSGTALSTETSNVSSNKTLTAASSFGTDPDGIYYYDQGDYYYSDTYNFYGDYLDTYTGGQTIYGHFRVGDFYSWNAATAGSGALVSDARESATESICPKGWRLPTNNGAGEVLKGSYDNMIFRFLDKNVFSGYSSYYGYGGVDNQKEVDYYSGSNNISYPPLYFHTTGMINESGELIDAGSVSAYWSSSLKYRDDSEAAHAYQLKINESSRVNYKPNESSATKSFYGAKVRCVADSGEEYSSQDNYFTIDYDANGGEYAPTSQIASAEWDSYTFVITTSTPSYSQHVFKGWATSPNADAAEYLPGDRITVTNIVTKLYAVWEEACSGICYYGNGADAGTMPDQTVNGGDSVMLLPSNFSRAGYGFAGWNTEPDGSGTMYGPIETITVPDEGILQLYATWLAPSGYIQGFNCNSLAQGKVTALTDIRDGQVYAVAKLVDGKCWMIENLRLNPADENTIINASNTNNPTQTFVDDIANNFRGNGDIGAYFSDCDLSGGVSSIGCSDRVAFLTNNIYRGYSANYLTDVVTSSWYSYGILYNWHTATAGNGSWYDSGQFTDVDTYITYQGDICPSGWHLPTSEYGGGDNNLLEFGLALGNTLGNVASQSDLYNDDIWPRFTAALRAYPNNFVEAGYYNPVLRASGYPYGYSSRGSAGYYWTATQRVDRYGSGHYAEILWIHDLSNSRVYWTVEYLDRGATVRCVTGN